MVKKYLLTNLNNIHVISSIVVVSKISIENIVIIVVVVVIPVIVVAVDVLCDVHGSVDQGENQAHKPD